MSRIDFYVSCFDRSLCVFVSAEHADKTYQIMQSAYDRWVSDDPDADGTCCEEYILSQLNLYGIEFTEVLSGV